MGHPSPVKGKNLQHRELIRCRLILDFMGGLQISSDQLKTRYYSSIAPGAFHKTFKRDREALAEEGIFLEETSKGPSKYWRLDEKSLANTAAITEIERKTCAILLKAAMSSPDLTTPSSLGFSVAKIGQSGTADIQQIPAQNIDHNKEALSILGDTLRTHIPLEITYQSNNESRAHRCIFYPYGMFSLGSSAYVVGLRSTKGKPDAIRTFNTDRFHSLKPLNAKTGQAATYNVPDDFSIDSYILLPFEIGDEEQKSCSFLIEPQDINAIKGAVHGRGSFTPSQNGSMLWVCDNLKNTPMAASWAIEVGVIPLSPTSLIEEWKTLNEVGRL